MILHTLIYFGLAMIAKSSRVGFILAVIVGNCSGMVNVGLSFVTKSAWVSHIGLGVLSQNISNLNITWYMPINILIIVLVAAIINFVGWKRFNQAEN